MHAGDGAAEAGVTQQSDSAEPMEEDGAEDASADDAELEPGEQPVPKRRKPSGAAVSSAEQVACMAIALMLRPLHQCNKLDSPCRPAACPSLLSEVLP